MVEGHNRGWIYALASSWGLVFAWMVYKLARAYQHIQCGILSALNPNREIADVIFLFATVCAFSITTYYALRPGLKDGFVKNNLVLTVVFLGILVAFFSVPFNTHDSSYYFGAGKAVYEKINVYTTHWPMHNQFQCPQKEISVQGVAYGPVALWMFEGVYLLGAKTFFGFEFIWKLLMICALVAIGALTAQIIPRHEQTKEVFIVLCASFPFIVWQVIGSGHFDALWIVAVLGSLVAAQKKRWWVAFVLLTIGTWIKFLPILVAPWVVLWWWQDTIKGNWKKNIGQMIIAIIVSAGVTIVSWARWWDGLKTLQSILLQSKWAATSVFSALYYSALPFAQDLLGDGYHWALTRIIHAILIVGVAYLLYPLGVRVWRVCLKKESWSSVEYIIAITVTLSVYIILWQKSFWPWYVAWLILLFLHKNIREHLYIRAIALWFAIAPLVFYIILIGYNVAYKEDVVGQLWFNWLMVVLLWTYPLVVLMRWRKKGYALEIK